MRSVRRLRGKTGGFTLLEMLTVVAIIGISAAVAAPALMESMADRRASEASHSLVRIGARARTEALAFGRAHVLVYSDASTGPGGAFGSVTLWRGRLDRCFANDWTTIIVGACAGNTDCIDSVDFGAYAYPTHRVQLRLPGVTAGAICFQPDGDTYFANSPVGIWGSTAPAGTEGVRFTIDRLTGGAISGVQRAVVFPFGGTARLDR